MRPVVFLAKLICFFVVVFLSLHFLCSVFLIVYPMHYNREFGAQFIFPE